MHVNDLENVPASLARSLGHRFAAAIAARDAAALLAMLDAEVDFRGMTPGRVWEARSAAAVVDDVILGKWFEPSDVVERVEAVETGMVGDRCRLGYRLRVANEGGSFVVEQQAFYDITGNKITWLRMLCSGFRPVTSPP
ncbi:MAG: hypothetical protein ACM3ML_08485 [Micromonosporaceae bacterium]